MVRVGRAQWRSHGATGEAGNGRPPLIPPRDAVITARSIYRGSLTHRKPRHRPAHQPPHLPQGPRGAPCLFSFGRVRYRGLWCVVGVGQQPEEPAVLRCRLAQHPLRVCGQAANPFADNPNWRHATGAGYNCSNGSWQVQLLHAQNTPNELEQL